MVPLGGHHRVAVLVCHDPGVELADFVSNDSALLATVLRPLDDIGQDWVDHVVEFIMRGTAPWISD